MRQPIRHGTETGYRAHIRTGVTVCDACADAHTAATDRRSRVRRNTAHQMALERLAPYAPDLYRQLFDEACREWDRANPITQEQQ